MTHVVGLDRVSALFDYFRDDSGEEFTGVPERGSMESCLDGIFAPVHVAVDRVFSDDKREFTVSRRVMPGDDMIVFSLWSESIPDFESVSVIRAFDEETDSHPIRVALAGDMPYVMGFDSVSAVTEPVFSVISEAGVRAVVVEFVRRAVAFFLRSEPGVEVSSFYTSRESLELYLRHGDGNIPGSCRFLFTDEALNLISDGSFEPGVRDYVNIPYSDPVFMVNVYVGSGGIVDIEFNIADFPVFWYGL